MRARPISVALLGAAASLVAPTTAPAFTFHADHVLGTSLDVAIVAANQALADLAMRTIHAEIARLDKILSGWRPDSELAILNGASVHRASPDLFAVISAGEIWRQRTQSAFSLRLGRLADASPQEAGPLARAIEAADLSLDGHSLEIRRPQPVRFAVDGLAKGYILDQAMAAARQMPGVQGLMIDIGGDIGCWGQSPDGAGWKIGLLNSGYQSDNSAPASVLRLTEGAVATSGKGARQDVIWHPGSGMASEGTVLATAVAPTAADADALATALYVLPPEKGLALVNSMPRSAARIVASDGTVQLSDRWNTMVLAQNNTARPPSASGWPSGFAVRIDYEIPAISGGRRPHAPYVAVWISDERGTPVRTLAFYANKARYMPEEYVFWERVAGNNRTLLNSVTRPTRPPGTYSLDWDGRDDAGRPLPPGRYTVNIEAAREHGGHNLQRIDINAGTTPASASAAPQQEIGAVKVTYGK